MNMNLTLRRATLLLALALPSLCWGFDPPSALIVTETGAPFQSDINKVVTFLSGRLTAASFTVTTNNGVPAGSLAGYQQIWDIRADTALSGSDITAYVAYMAAGGSLFAMGENGGCCGVRDASVVALIAAAGGGAVTTETFSNNTQTVQAPFTGPVSLTTLTYAAIGGFTSIGSGAFISKDTNTSGGAVIFGPGTMTNASAGVLASVFDINFMDSPGPGVSQPLTDNLIAYFAAPVIITPPGATSFTFTGPSGGAINAASGAFAITPNLAYTGTITITPTGGGLSTPIVLTFSGSATAQTFTITPTAAGPVTLTATNNGSLTNPAALTYATPPSAPTIGAATPGAGSASVAFTPPTTTGGSPITSYTATCNPGGITGTGVSSPVTVSGLTPGTTYTCTVTATNGRGVSAASAASNQVTPGATGYTFGGPASGAINSASGNFTVTPNAPYTGTITITPTGGGLSTPIVLTFTASAATQTFTITPTAAGPVTLTPTNSGSLTNPAAWNYATPASAPTIGTATASAGAASVAFTAPSSTGGVAITLYTATCNPGGISRVGTSSPITVTGLTPGSSYTCSVTATNSAGISAASSPSNQVTIPQTGYTLTGPAGGLINNQSGIFTITPNSAFTGNITITVSGGGATAAIMRRSGNAPGAKGGPLAAIVRSFNNSSAPQTFTITPTSVGPVTVTATNDASLANPPSLSYATQPGTPVIGSATGGSGSVVVSFTPPSSGGSPITSYTATCTGGATATGPSSPLTVTGLGSGSTFACSVTASNSFGVSAASNLSNPVSPSVSPTPAPATWGLVSIGLVALLLWNRRRALRV